MFDKTIRNAGFCAVATAALALLPGCGRDEIQSYSAPKDPPPSRPPAAGHNHAHPPGNDPHGMMAGGSMSLTFKAPEGWREKPAGQMRAAQFAVPGKDGLEADVSVIPLAGMSASREEILNIWREQVKLPPLEQGAAVKEVESIQVAGQAADLYDMVSSELLVEGKAKLRIITAVFVREQTSWFVKLTGPDELVRQTKPALLDFLKSISFGEGAAHHDSPTTEHPTSTQPGAPKLHPPAHWKLVAPGPMVAFKFLAGGEAGTSAEITVSSLSGDGGGLLPNLNRWRGQLLLQPIGQEEAAKLGAQLQVGDRQVVYYDMKGTSSKDGNPARMVVLGLPMGGQSWFYKLLGDEAVVEKEKANFLKLVQTAH